MSYFLLELALRLYNYTIDIRDYVNGIGNRSREQYVNDGRALRVIVRWPRTPCYSEVDGFVELYVL